MRSEGTTFPTEQNEYAAIVQTNMADAPPPLSVGIIPEYVNRPSVRGPSASEHNMQAVHDRNTRLSVANLKSKYSQQI